LGYPIIEVEGIGEIYRRKLNQARITTTDDLLARCRTPSHREMLAAETGIGEKLILEWANLADLMRISGVAEEYADLLEEAGVDTVKELKHRVPENLHSKLVEVNEEKNLVRRLPSPEDVADWVEQAKSLEPMLEY
jgi:predicted flap endonuclease-1-like 5' DNA nuclease